ncbi:MAG: hypothetical protein RBT62_11995 [Spirochaetia bacterium]|jgi:hypothetical protein|nr:hypothetical protein [Spirochaetia bacterium]
MITMGKRATLLRLCFLIPAAVFAAPNPGISLGSWSFVGVPEPGMYAHAGFLLGVSDHFELEALGVAEFMPIPAGMLLAGVSLGYSVLGPRTPTYFNMVADFSFLQALVSSGVPGLGQSYLMLRLSPLVIGNPIYGHRDRLFSMGLLYDIQASSFSAVWNILIIDWYPS